MLVQAQSSAAAIFTGSNGIGAWRALNRNLDQRLTQFAKEPEIARAIAYFRAEFKNIGSADELVDDQSLFETVLTAYDLEGQENAQGLIRRVLSEDLSDPGAAANRMSDQRYVAMARDLGFAGTTGGDQELVDDLIEGYLKTTYEMRTGTTLPKITTDAQDEALEDLALEPAIASAISAARQSLGTVSSIDAVLADKELLAFAYRAAGFKAGAVPDDRLTRAILTEETTRDAMGDERWATFATFFEPAAEGRKLRTDGRDVAIDLMVERWTAATYTLETGRSAREPRTAPVQAAVDAFAALEDVQERTAEFRREMANISNTSDLLANPRAYSFVLRASGAEQHRRNIDVVLRTLTEPVDSRTSPAQYDTGLKTLAEGLSFLTGRGSPATRDEEFVDELVDRYVRIQFERAVGAVDSSMRIALYAERKLGKVTTPYQILGDTVLRELVFPAIGLSASLNLDVDRLAGIVERKLDLGTLKDPAVVDRLTQRFLAQAQTGTGGSSDGRSQALTILTFLNATETGATSIEQLIAQRVLTN